MRLNIKKVTKISLLILSIVSIILLFIYAFILQNNIMQYTYDHINKIFFDGESVVDTNISGKKYPNDLVFTSPPLQFFDLNKKQKIEPEEYWDANLNENHTIERSLTKPFSIEPEEYRGANLNENKTTLAYMRQYRVPNYFVKPGYMTFRQSYKIEGNNYIYISISYYLFQNSIIKSDYLSVPEFSFSVYFNKDFDYSMYTQEELNSFYNNCFELFKTNVLDKIYNATNQFSPKYWGYIFTSTYYTNDFFANKEINKNNYFTNQNKVYTKMMSMIVKV